MLRSAIVVPSSRLAVPSRPIIRPGWDDLPVDRPRRRSAWWRQLLAGAAGVTQFQPGACCGCGGHTCSSCSNIPDTLTFSYTFASVAGKSCPSFSSSCTLTFSSGSWSGTMALPACSTCAGCNFGTPPTSLTPILGCSTFFITLSFNELPACNFGLFGSGSVGSFACSPFLWTYTTPSGTCPQACSDSFGSGCWYISNLTISA